MAKDIEGGDGSMTGANIVDSVILQFLSVAQVEGKLPPDVVLQLKRLAEEGELWEQDKIEAALKGEAIPNDEAEEP
jgi:hypothetical protein